jgi:hypothetical protein
VRCYFEISTVDCSLAEAGRKETSVFRSDYLVDQHASVQLTSDKMIKNGRDHYEGLVAFLTDVFVSRHVNSL